ncbi:MAG: CHAT domain-containing protein [Armatimonadota bacterium]
MRLSAQWQRLSQQLYAQLVAPVQGWLKGAQRVLLCPDGVLSQLPWAALIVKVHDGKPVYWVEQVALHITPSVGVYRQAQQVSPVSAGAAIAAVWRYTNGKPIELAQGRSVVAMLLRRSGAGTVLEDLRHAPKELQALRTAFGKGAQVVVNAQATPQQAKRLAAQARVVHFICHARVDNADPLGSALLLAPAGAPAGLLTAGEVLLGWRLRADLVMLSACETGLGVARRYEGVYSLGRAFLVAGSRSVGMSLWKVDDAATVALMKGFYARYVGGLGKDEALRGAQLGLLRNAKFSDPFYWSAFVLMGDYRQGR